MPYYTVDVYDNDLVRIDINDEFIKDMSWLFNKNSKDKEAFVKLMRKHEGESVHDVDVHIGSIQVHSSDLKETVINYLQDNDDPTGEGTNSNENWVVPALEKKVTIEKINDIVYKLDKIIYRNDENLSKKELLDIREFLKELTNG